ncbi:MAG: tetraacyldisaccharide 4'-kinase [Breznakibacter sp.]
MVSRFRLLLFPLSLIYGLVVWLRNQCFNNGWLKTKRFDVPIISIGNITVGGTGKTPHTEYLVRLLGLTYRVGIVSRGYLRETKGVVIANGNSTSETIGDEPMQMKLKFPDIDIVVAEKRAEGIEKCLSLPSKPQMVLLDDAHQHRYVTPGLSIVLVDYYRPVWSDFYLPAGNLREGLSGLKRAQIVVITKCPANMQGEEAESIAKKLKLSSSQRLFFTTLAYGVPYPLDKTRQKSFLVNDGCAILAFTAIANVLPFHAYLANMAQQVVTITLPDHHRFTETDIKVLNQKFNAIGNHDKWIAVTEKDAVKLNEINYLPREVISHIGIVPVEPRFLFNQENSFNSQILKYAGKS